MVDELRALWRRVKGPVLAGRGNLLQRTIYRLLAGIATGSKAYFHATDLQALALWLMYHPEAGILPCEGWTMKSPPVLSDGELKALSARYAADMRAVAERLRLEDVECSPRAAPPKDPVSIAVHVHVFYPELFPRIQKGLDCIAAPFDLFVSVPDGVAVPRELEGRPRCVVERCPNRGRDIAPLLCTFGRKLSAYDCVAHFHTKKSAHVVDRRDWLDHVLSCLLCGAERVNGILHMLAGGYGMVTASDYVPVPEDPTGWMRNLPYAESIVGRSGLDLDLRRDYTPVLFPQGSMFWARGDFLRRFFELPLSFEDFPQEPLGVDGSLAHALERMFFLWGAGTGMNVARLSEGG